MRDIKELYELLDASSNDDDRMHILFDIATFFLNTNEQRMLEVADEIKTLAERLDSHIGRCYYHSTIGRMLYRKSLFEDAAVAFQTALDFSLLTDDLLMQAMCYDSVGVVCNPLYRYKEALETSFKALAIYEKIGSKAARWQIAVCYNNIGVTYKKMHELDKAEESFLKGLAMNDIEPNDRMEYNLLSNLCDVKISKAKFDEGISHVVPAIAGFKKLNHKIGEAHATALLAHCYLGKGEFALALQHYISALKVLKDVDHKLTEIQAMRGIGNVYMQMQAYDEALNHYQKALAVATAIGDYNEVCDMHISIGQAYIALEKLDEAKQTFLLGIELAKEKNLLVELHKLQAISPFKEMA